MAKSQVKAKVKKRLRAVKRGVLKRDTSTEGTTYQKRAASKESKMAGALTGDIAPPPRVRNAFRFDDTEAEIPQHDWRQALPVLNELSTENSKFQTQIFQRLWIEVHHELLELL